MKKYDLEVESSGCGCLIYLVVPIVVLAICALSTYLIATSNLPDWLKFLLLK
jgi:hypothetical protein